MKDTSLLHAVGGYDHGQRLDVSSKKLEGKDRAVEDTLWLNLFHSLFSLLCLFDDNVCKCMCVCVCDCNMFSPWSRIFWPQPLFNYNSFILSTTKQRHVKSLFGLLCCYNVKNIHGEEIYLVSFAYPKETPNEFAIYFLNVDLIQHITSQNHQLFCNNKACYLYRCLG